MAESVPSHDFTQGFGSFDFAVPPDPERPTDFELEQGTSWKVRVFRKKPYANL